MTQRCTALANGEADALADAEAERAGGAGDVELVAVGVAVEAGDEAAQQPRGRRPEHPEPEQLDVGRAGIVAAPVDDRIEPGVDGDAARQRVDGGGRGVG